MQAAQQLLENLHEQLATKLDLTQSDCCFRLKERNSNLVITVEEPEVEDTTFEFSGRTVLAVDSAVEARCADKTLLMEEDKWILR